MHFSLVSIEAGLLPIFRLRAGKNGEEKMSKK